MEGNRLQRQLKPSSFDPAEVEHFVDEAQQVAAAAERSEEHTSELQSPYDLVCRLLPEKNNGARLRPVLVRARGSRRDRARPARQGRVRVGEVSQVRARISCGVGPGDGALAERRPGDDT